MLKILRLFKTFAADVWVRFSKFVDLVTFIKFKNILWYESFYFP